MQQNNTTIPHNLNNLEQLSTFYENIMIPNLTPDANILHFYLQHIKENVGTFHCKMTIEDELANILRSIKSKTVGYDNVCIDMLSLYCPSILPVLTHLINICILQIRFQMYVKYRISFL